VLLSLNYVHLSIFKLINTVLQVSCTITSLLFRWNVYIMLNIFNIWYLYENFRKVTAYLI